MRIFKFLNINVRCPRDFIFERAYPVVVEFFVTEDEQEGITCNGCDYLDSSSICEYCKGETLKYVYSHQVRNGDTISFSPPQSQK